MAEGVEKHTTQSEAFVNIAAKIGKVLSKTKEAILADLQNEIPDLDFKAIDPGDDKKDAVEQIKSMVDAVFVKLGYDFSDCENLEKFSDKIIKILKEMEKIFVAFSDLDTKEDYNAANLLMAMAPAIKNMIKQIQDFVDEETDAAGAEVVMKIEGFDHKGFIKRIVEYVLMTLLKNARQVFSAEVEFIEMKVQLARQTVEDLKKEITDNFQKVKDEVDAARRQAEEEFDQVLTAYKKDYDRIRKDLEDSIKQIQNSYADIKEGIKSDIDSITSEVEKEAKERFNALVVKLKEEEGYSEKAIAELLDENSEVIVKITRVFNITYSILEFAGIIEERTLTIELPSSIIKSIRSAKSDVTSLAEKEPLSTLGSMLGISNASVETALLQMALVKDSADAVTEQLIDKLDNFSYQLKYYTINWSKTKDLFTSPVSHFKSVYPVNDLSDAKAIAEKFMRMLHLINPDIPDFDSLLNMLESLLKKLKTRIAKLASEIKSAADEAVKTAKQKIMEFLRPLIDNVKAMIDFIKSVARQLKEEMSEVIENLKLAMNSIGSRIETVASSYYRQLCLLRDDAEDKISEQIKTITDETGKTLDKLNDINFTLPSLEGFSLRTNIINPALAGFTGIDYSLDIDLGDASAEVRAAFTEFTGELELSFGTIASESRASIAAWAEEVGANIKTITSPDIWKGRLESLLSQLEAEFQGDMQTLKNFDINSYITIVKTAVTDIVLPDPELYFDSFKDVAEGILSNIKTKFYDLLQTLKAKLAVLKGVALQKGQEIYDKIKAKYDEIEAAFESAASRIEGGVEAFRKLVSDFGNQLWKRVKEQLIMPVVTSIRNAIIDLVRQLIQKAINKIIDKVCESESIDRLFRDINGFKADAQKIISDPAAILKTEAVQDAISGTYEIDGTKMKAAVADAVERARGLITSVITFTTSEKKFSDIITLVKALYDSVPAAVRQEVSDLLPTMPDNVLTDYCKDLEYETDLNNLFFSVTLLDLGNKNAKVQLTISVADYKYEEKVGTLAVAKSAPSLAFIFNLEGNVGSVFNVSENNQLGLLTAGALHNIGFCLTGNVDGGYIHAVGVKEPDYNLLMAIFFGRSAGSDKAVWLNSQYLDISVKDYPTIVYAGYNPFTNEAVSGQDKIALVKSKMSDGEIAAKGFRVGFLAALDELEFNLKLRQNEMLKQFLKDDISLQIGTYIGYDMEAGLKIGGDAKLHLELDMGEKKLGPVTIESFAVDAGTVGGNIGSFELGVTSSFSLDMSAVKLSLSNMGVSMSAEFLDPKTYKFHSPEFGAGFKWPDAIAVAIDATAVKGSGMISYDDGTLMGALQITVINMFGVQGFLLCDTGEKPGHTFSLATMISASFNPGIPLGMGFSVTALGGALGINRKLDRKQLTEGVRNGTLSKVFFVEDIASNLAQMKANAEAFFPVKKGQFYLGLLGQLSYAPVVKCDFGLFLQLPDPAEIIIVGALKVTVGDDPKMEDYILINVVFAGGINFEEGIWFDASLINSKIVGLELAGDMAFRLFWGGETKGFLMTMGGFHPAYKPEEGMLVSNLRRMSIGLNYSIVAIKLETYMAVTSNTFQIGANLDLKIGWDKFGLKGYLGFDALFQFDPFLFMFDARAGVAVMLGKVKLLSVDLNLNVQGPGPWIIKGNAKFYFVLIPISVNVDLSWGDDTPQLPSAEISTLELLLKQLDNLSNWECSASDDADTSVALGNLDKGSGEKKTKLLNPDSKIAFNQSVIPMHTEKDGKVVFETMTICNNARPVDFNDYTIEKIYIGKTEVPQGQWYDRKNDFAPAMYKNLSAKEKIKLPSYESYNSGFGSMSALNTRKPDESISIKTEHIKYGSSTKFEQKVDVFNATKPMPGDKTGAQRYMKELTDKMNSLKNN